MITKNIAPDHLADNQCKHRNSS